MALCRVCLTLFAFLLVAVSAPALNLGTATDTTNNLYWSADRKVQFSDFQPKLDSTARGSTSFQVFYEYNLKGNDFKTDSFTCRIYTYLDKSASWIDTTFTPANIVLRYIQTAFDISEVYTREFKKRLQARQTELKQGTAVVTDLENQIDLEKSQLLALYDSQTKYGTNSPEQARWEVKVTQLLKELENFACQGEPSTKAVPQINLLR